MEEQVCLFQLHQYIQLGEGDIGTKFLLEDGFEGLVAGLDSGHAVLINRQKRKEGIDYIVDYIDNFPLPIEMHQMEGEELEIVKIEGSREIIRPEGIAVVRYWNKLYESLDAQLRQADL